MVPNELGLARRYVFSRELDIEVICTATTQLVECAARTTFGAIPDY